MEFETRTDCEHCEGAGYVEFSTDHFEPREGHYTREHRETCDRCGGEGRVWVTREADPALTALLIAATARMYATRVAAAQTAAKHLDVALDHDADAAIALFVGSATEAPAVAA